VSGVYRPSTAYTARTRGGASNRVMLLYELPLVDGRGRLLQQEHIAIAVPIRPRRVLTRSVIRSIVCDASVLRVLEQESVRRTRTLAPLVQDAGTRLAERADALAAALRHRSGTVLWQASLFDRRREQAAAQAREQIALYIRHLEGHRQAAMDLTTVVASAPQLVAAWLESC
jgi:hypothetical protein